VLSRSSFTVSIFNVGSLDGSLDSFELFNDFSQSFRVELGGKLNQSLDGVRLRDSAQGTLDFLLGDL